jgi:hypothetical protein
MLAEKASQSKEAVCPACKTFTPSHPTFLSGIQQGAEIYQQEHLSDIALTYLAMLAFYQRNLTPFQFDPPGHTGILLGWVRAFLASGHAPEFYSESTDFLVSYHLASQDWRAWPKDELLTDIGFAAGLENEISPQTLATMQRAEPWYTRAYQIGYAFGLARDLLSSPDIQMIEHQAYPQAA